MSQYFFYSQEIFLKYPKLFSKPNQIQSLITKNKIRKSLTALLKWQYSSICASMAHPYIWSTFRPNMLMADKLETNPMNRLDLEGTVALQKFPHF